MSAADRVIRLSTAAAVLAVAGVAAYVSYWHAYEVVSAHGETGVTARLEPATIDGLVYSSSMVVLYAARHQLPAPPLARWLLALGIVATLAANVAHGWSHGPVGAAVAAWPAASLVGSYELLLWLIRTAAVATLARGPESDQSAGLAGQPADRVTAIPWSWNGEANDLVAPADNVDGAGATRQPQTSLTRSTARCHIAGAARVGQVRACLRLQVYPYGASQDDSMAVDAAAVAAYRASVDEGKPLSERRLAAMFGKSSRRWARNRIAEARMFSDPAVGEYR